MINNVRAVVILNFWCKRYYIKMPETLPIVGDYRIVGTMGEGTFSEVLKCQSLLNGKLYACKKMKQKYSSINQVNNLREIQALRRLNPHPNVIDLKEVIFDRQSGTLSLICELMDMNIYELIKDRRNYLPESRVKLYMYQLCKSLYHMHRNGIFHRDVKPENILIKDDVLKLADFGSCKSMYSKLPYTEYISTRWYRAPECLLTDGHYGHKMDMWSVGCVLYELMSLRPLFPGSNELDQIHKIHEVVGSPTPQVLEKFRKIQSRSMEFNFPYKQPTGVAQMLRHATKQCIDLINKLCIYDPDQRITAKDALRHPFFKDLREAERKSKMRLKVQQELPNTIVTNTPQYTHDEGPQRRLQYRQPRMKQKEDTHNFVSIKPKQYYMPKVAPSNFPKLMLPQVPKPPIQGRTHYHHGSGLSSGLPSLSHSIKGPGHISTFPSLFSGDNAPAKSTSTHQPIKAHRDDSSHHLPLLSKRGSVVQRTDLY